MMYINSLYLNVAGVFHSPGASQFICCLPIGSLGCLSLGPVSVKASVNIRFVSHVSEAARMKQWIHADGADSTFRPLPDVFTIGLPFASSRQCLQVPSPPARGMLGLLIRSYS